MLLVGGSIAFASGALAPRGPAPGAETSTSPLPAPTLLVPLETLTKSDTIDLTVVRPTGLALDAAYRVRVFVNDALARERALPAQEQFQIADVPLVEGANVIRVALVGNGVLGELSAALSIERDDVAPLIRVFRPQANSTVYAENEVMRGRTEAGASLAITDLLSGRQLETTVQVDGRFEANLVLELGENQLLLESRDRAGNEASTHIVLNRVESLASITLTVSAAQLSAGDLPRRLEARAIVTDERGLLVDGVEVTFSLSPPNAATMTYRTTSVGGRATWPQMNIDSPDGPLGTWLVTVLAVLPSGTELRDAESLIVR